MITLRYGVDWNRLQGFAQVETIERSDGKIAVVVTEPEHNPGPSVTNAAEYIATALYREGWRWDFYVEHYTDHLNMQTGEREHSWDFCVFNWNADLERFDEPQWHPCGEEYYQELIAGKRTPEDDYKQTWPERPQDDWI